jgi:hypothetical protein
MKIKLIAQNIEVNSLYWTLKQNPQLWNQYTSRTENCNSPHNGLDDIWVRFGTPDDAKQNNPHISKWYPCEELLQVKNFCYDLMRAVNGVELGGVLITRIKPGETCKPHIDSGFHADRYEKYGVQITSAPGQKFCFDDVKLETKPGDVFWFDNHFNHWVENPTDYERITMIIAIRKDQ